MIWPVGNAGGPEPGWCSYAIAVSGMQDFSAKGSLADVKEANCPLDVCKGLRISVLKKIEPAAAGQMIAEAANQFIWVRLADTKEIDQIVV